MRLFYIKNSEAGFTLPELISSVIVSGLFVGLILFFMISYWRYGSLQESNLDTFVARLDAGDYFRENLGKSSGTINQNSITDSHTMAPDPAIGSNLYWQPLHAVPGNTTVGSAGTYIPVLYYHEFSVNSAGNYIMNGNYPYEDEYMVYIDSSAKAIKVRSLANPNASGNRLKTSCPTGQATASCPEDKTIVDNLASIDLRYFSRSGNLIDWTSVTDPITGLYAGPDFTAVEAVEMDIHLAKKTLFQTATSTVNDTVIRVALRNI